MRENSKSNQPFFPASEIDGGSIIAIEVGPRSEMLRKSLSFNKENRPMEPPKKVGASDPAHKLPEAAIRIGAQIGDEEASEAVSAHIMDLKAKIKQSCRRSYSDEISEFSFVVRVDGAIWYWELEGCARMRLNRKGHYITIDMYMPQRRWKGVAEQAVREYLANGLEVGLRSMIAKLQREKIAVDESALLHDLARVRAAYLQLAAVAASL